MGVEWGLALLFPFPFLAFLFLCHQLISSYPRLPVMVRCSLPLSLCFSSCLCFFCVCESTSGFISLSVTPPSASFSLSSSVVTCVSLSSYLSLGLFLSVLPAFSAALPLDVRPLPLRPLLLPPSARLPSPYLAGREGWREEVACGRGTGGGSGARRRRAVGGAEGTAPRRPRRRRWRRGPRGAERVPGAGSGERSHAPGRLRGSSSGG